MSNLVFTFILEINITKLTRDQNDYTYHYQPHGVARGQRVAELSSLHVYSCNTDLRSHGASYQTFVFNRNPQPVQCPGTGHRTGPLLLFGLLGGWHGNVERSRGAYAVSARF